VDAVQVPVDEGNLVDIVTRYIENGFLSKSMKDLETSRYPNRYRNFTATHSRPFRETVSSFRLSDSIQTVFYVYAFTVSLSFLAAIVELKDICADICVKSVRKFKRFLLIFLHWVYKH
jgi:hypothetical protein